MEPAARSDFHGNRKDPEVKVPTTHTATRTRAGKCPVHGEVQGEKSVPTPSWPVLAYLGRRVAAEFQPYHCPTCGAKMA